MKAWLSSLGVLALLATTSCVRSCRGGGPNLSPEQVVEAYLEASLNLNSIEQREALLKLTTGNLHDAIQQAPEDIIKAAFIEKNYQLEKYLVIGRRDRTPRETEVTFSIEYLSLGAKRETPPGQAPRTKTENTVVLLKEKGAWLISDVLGKKTSIDFQYEEQITPGASPGNVPVPEAETPTETVNP